MGVYVDPVSKQAVVDILTNRELIRKIKNREDAQAEAIVAQVYELYRGNHSGLLLEKINQMATNWVDGVTHGDLADASRGAVESFIEKYIRVN